MSLTSLKRKEKPLAILWSEVQNKNAKIKPHMLVLKMMDQLINSVMYVIGPSEPMNFPQNLVRKMILLFHDFMGWVGWMRSLMDIC